MKKGYLYWRKKALAVAQQYARHSRSFNGYVTCISCGRVMPIESSDGGHYIPRTVKITELEQDNIWPQCKRCNAFEEGSTVLYREGLLREIGEERVERLENMYLASRGNEERYALLSDEDKRKIARKRTAADYEQIFREYSHKLREWKKENGTL